MWRQSPPVRTRASSQRLWHKIARNDKMTAHDASYARATDRRTRSARFSRVSGCELDDGGRGPRPEQAPLPTGRHDRAAPSQSRPHEAIHEATDEATNDAILREQIRYYQERAAEYDSSILDGDETTA